MLYQRTLLAVTVMLLSFGAHNAEAKLYDPEEQASIPFVLTPEPIEQEPLSATVEIDVIQMGPGGAINTNGKTKEEWAREYFENPLPLSPTSVVLPPD